MQFQSNQQPLEKLNTECLVLSMSEKGIEDGSVLEKLNNQSNGFIRQQIKSLGFKGKAESSLMLNGIPNVKAKRILIVGTGKTSLNRFNTNKLIKLIANQTSQFNGALALNLNNLALADDTTSWLAGQIVLAVKAAQYKYKSSESKQAGIKKIIWHGQQHTVSMKQAYAIALGIEAAKRLGDTPPNICTPSFLAKQAKKLAKEHESLEVSVLDEKDMKEMGADAFVSVAKGSKEPGKLVILNYQGAKKSDAPHMLVGKGITFDTGGISLKPGQKMDEMKYDMCGAASVLGTVRSIVELQPKINLIAILTCAENMPAGNASKPGDVVKSLSGQTIEILNTDAEGRLVLCDALTYGIKEYKPESVVDIATLTGACMAALGGVNSGLFSSDDDLAEELISAGEIANDAVWRLPLQQEYQSLLDSNFADIANIGGPLAGATTAACFLSRFTKDTPWAHLDIAGTAWNSGGKEKGATGRPVSLLVNYLLAK